MRRTMPMTDSPMSSSTRSRLVSLAIVAIAMACTRSSRANIDIVPTFDSTITSDPNASTIESTINSAILVYEHHYTDPITVNIKFQEGGGLGSSSTWIGSIAYSTFRTKLIADQSTADDSTAVAHIPAGPANGVDSGSSIILSTANFRAIGISTGATPDGFDGTITLNTSIMNLSRPGSDPSKYDLMAVAQHEMDEVLGLGSGLDGSSTIRPEDLFRYTSAGARTYTTSGDNAYFSIDGGVTQLARFNQNSSGDRGDWWSTGTHTPQVQDAFGTPGAAPYMGAEFRALDVVGYNFTAKLGDMNGDGATNNFDISAFELALANPTTYQATFPTVTDYQIRGDVNLDSSFNNFDIGQFETLLAGGAGGVPVPEPSTLVLAMAGLVAGAVFASQKCRVVTPDDR